MRFTIYSPSQFKNRLNQYNISLPSYLQPLRKPIVVDPRSIATHRDQLYQIVANLELYEIINLCKSDKQLSTTCQQDRKIMNLIRDKQQQIKQKTDEFIRSLNDGYYHLDPITTAIYSEKLDIIDELIKRGYDPSADNNLPIQVASEQGYLNVIERLLQDPRVNPGDNGNMSIINAIYKGHLNVAKRLLRDQRINPNNKTRVLGSTILGEAAKKGYLDLVDLILQDPRTDPSIKNNEALTSAIKNANLELVDMLLSHPRLVITANDYLSEVMFSADDNIMDRLEQDPRVVKVYAKKFLKQNRKF